MLQPQFLVFHIMYYNYYFNIALLLENSIRRFQGYLRGGAQGLYQGGIVGCFREAAQGYYGRYQVDDDDDDQDSYYDSDSEGYYDRDSIEVYEIEW